jgi:hypothetical protein
MNPKEIRTQGGGAITAAKIMAAIDGSSTPRGE